MSLTSRTLTPGEWAVRPRWRFQRLRDLVRSLPRRQMVEALDEIDCLEARLLPPIPTITEFHRRARGA